VFELFCNKGPCGVAGKDSIVEVPSYQEEVWTVFQCEVDERFEATLEVSFSLEPFGTILYG